MARLKNFRFIWGFPEDAFICAHAKEKVWLISEMRPHLGGILYLAKRFKHATFISDNMLGFFFYKKAIKEVVIFYQDRDSLGYQLIPGSYSVIILAKRHGVPIRFLKGNPQPDFKPKDRHSLTFMGKNITSPGVLPILPEATFAEYKFLEKDYF